MAHTDHKVFYLNMPDSENQKPDVLFVGAGPVGLYTAIQAKLHNPDLNIVMFERHEEYVRHHILIIDKKSYQGSHSDAEFQGILSNLQGPVPTSKIEADLKEFAQKIGIRIEHKKIENVAELSEEYPEAHTIVGADGARSMVRKQVFGEEKAVEEELQYIVEVKYKARGDVQKLHPGSYGLALSQVEHFVAEHVGKRDNDSQTPVSLFFFVDKETYEEVRALGGSAAQGLKLKHINPQQSVNMNRLANSVRPWLAARRHTLKEGFVDGSEKIAGVVLPAYRSKAFAKQEHGKHYILIGDAAMGVPFFRALNAGLIGANNAAKLIAGKTIGLDLAGRGNQVDAFNRSMVSLADREITNARWKSRKINVGQLVAAGQRRVRKAFAFSMRPDQLQAMQNARVKRPNLFQRHPRLVTGLIVFALLIPILVLTGGTAAIPLLAGASVMAVVAASAAISAAAVAVLGTLVKATEFLISKVKKQPRVDLPGEDNIVTFPWESDSEAESGDDSDNDYHKQGRKKKVVFEPLFKKRNHRPNNRIIIEPVHSSDSDSTDDEHNASPTPKSP